jgi:hypothetical protein
LEAGFLVGDVEMADSSALESLDSCQRTEAPQRCKERIAEEEEKMLGG